MRLSTGGSSGSSSDGSGNEEEEEATEKTVTNAGTYSNKNEIQLFLVSPIYCTHTSKKDFKDRGLNILIDIVKKKG